MPQIDIRLPDPPTPAGSYIPAVRVGNLVYLSGQIPFVEGQIKYKGKLGKDVTADQGYQAARVCGLNALGALKNEIGDLHRVRRIVKLSGYVNSTEDFTDHPKVVNGASDLISEVFGEIGRHSRIALGANSLPLGSAVEIDLIAEISE